MCCGIDMFLDSNEYKDLVDVKRQMIDDILRDIPNLVTKTDLAKILNVTKCSLNRWHRANEIVFVKVGRHSCIPKESLRKYLYDVNREVQTNAKQPTRMVAEID